ncbi:hypothetical protein Q8A73_010289 [Channa argus]|nr:hypothetical protein Q8A73_010289 [Channa argus]
MSPGFFLSNPLVVCEEITIPLAGVNSQCQEDTLKIHQAVSHPNLTLSSLIIHLVAFLQSHLRDIQVVGVGLVKHVSMGTMNTMDMVTMNSMVTMDTMDTMDVVTTDTTDTTDTMDVVTTNVKLVIITCISNAGTENIVLG